MTWRDWLLLCAAWMVVTVVAPTIEEFVGKPLARAVRNLLDKHGRG